MPTMNASPIINNHIDRIWHQALQRYHNLYDNDLYLAATAGATTVERANFIIDQSLALCGYSAYQLKPNEQYTAAELAFLEKFV